MANKKKTIEELPGCGGEGSMITRTIKPKKKGAKEVQKEAKAAAEVKGQEGTQEAQEDTTEAFSKWERAQRVELLDIMLKVFGYACILGHCKCLIFGYFACGDKERGKFMINQYLRYVEEYKALNLAE